MIPLAWQSTCIAGNWIGDRFCVVQRFAATDDLLVDVRFRRITCDYKARYCYPERHHAMVALFTWDGQGDPPGPWERAERT